MANYTKSEESRRVPSALLSKLNYSIRRLRLSCSFECLYQQQETLCTVRPGDDGVTFINPPSKQVPRTATTTIQFYSIPFHSIQWAGSLVRTRVTIPASPT